MFNLVLLLTCAYCFVFKAIYVVWCIRICNWAFFPCMICKNVIIFMSKNPPINQSKNSFDNVNKNSTDQKPFHIRAGSNAFQTVTNNGQINSTFFFVTLFSFLNFCAGLQFLILFNSIIRILHDANQMLHANIKCSYIYHMQLFNVYRNDHCNF